VLRSMPGEICSVGALRPVSVLGGLTFKGVFCDCMWTVDLRWCRLCASGIGQKFWRALYDACVL